MVCFSLNTCSRSRELAPERRVKARMRVWMGPRAAAFRRIHAPALQPRHKAATCQPADRDPMHQPVSREGCTWLVKRYRFRLLSGRGHSRTMEFLLTRGPPHGCVTDRCPCHAAPPTHTAAHADPQSGRPYPPRLCASRPTMSDAVSCTSMRMASAPRRSMVRFRPCADCRGHCRIVRLESEPCYRVSRGVSPIHVTRGMKP